MTDKEVIEKAAKKWPDKRSRLANGFYKVKDKAGKVVPFKANPDQLKYLDESHDLDLILKARQKGFTTVIQLDFLDDCLFVPNTGAGVIAHNLTDAKAFFADKIKFAYDRLPAAFRRKVSAIQDSADSLKFSNGSSIRVGVSLRSGTLQRLHVSEYGKICAKFPEKAREIRTGAFNTIQAGQKIRVESTAEGEGGDFCDMCNKARAHEKEGLELTSLDFKFHFKPWFTTEEYTLDADVLITAEMQKYLVSINPYVESVQGHPLTDGQKAWYIKKREQQGFDMLREFPSTPDEAFKANIEGAYFKDQMAKLREQNRLCRIPIEDAPVYTTWDLGVNDEMCIVFWQDVGMERRAIDYYENSGEGWGHYFAVCVEKGYTYTGHYMPHDASHRMLNQTATTRQQEAEKAGFTNITVLPRIATEQEGIDASRSFFPSVYIDKERCDRLVQCLDNYRKEWDDNRGTWKNKPLHNWASHGYKAFETAAIRPAPKFEAPIKRDLRWVA